MNATAEAPAVKPPRKRDGSALATIPPPSQAPMALPEVLGHVQLIGQLMKEVLREGEHFGTIPGCGPNKCLFQSGAQKLALVFRLCPKYRVTLTKLDNNHREYQTVCVLRTIASQTLIAQGIGCASTAESKYRNRPPSDIANTVLKMSKKRAFVDAVITATSASDIFTQDVEDDRQGDKNAALQQLRRAAENSIEAMRTAWKALPPDVRSGLTAADIQSLKDYAASIESLVKEKL